MVRCGVVSHPRDWKWVGYHELLGNWRRHRVIDLERLCWRLGTASLEGVMEAPLTQLTTTSGGAFTDNPRRYNYYMTRAVKLITTPSSETYSEVSQGVAKP